MTAHDQASLAMEDPLRQAGSVSVRGIFVPRLSVLMVSAFQELHGLGNAASLPSVEHPRIVSRGWRDHPVVFDERVCGVECPHCLGNRHTGHLPDQLMSMEPGPMPRGALI